MTGKDELRVLHLIDNLSPGGTEKQCLALVRGLSARGVQNAVFYYRPGPLLEQLEQLGLTIRALPGGSFLSWQFPLQLVQIARAMRDWQPQIVQAYGFYSNIPGLLAGVLARVPVRIASRRELGTQLRPAQQRVQRWAWKLAHRVVANARVVREQLIAQEHVAPHRVVVIHNGLDLQQWALVSAAVEHGDGEPVVGMVAHFREGKGHATFLQAAQLVLQSLPSVRFCLVGSGRTEPAMRDYARQLGIAARVEFVGSVEGQALHDMVGRFRVALLTSESEALPNTVLEAMAAGLPVVATAVGGTAEVVEEGVTGFLVPPENPLALADRVSCLLKNPALARAMGVRGRRKVEHEFALEQMVEQFHRLYRSCLQPS